MSFDRLFSTTVLAGLAVLAWTMVAWLWAADQAHQARLMELRKPQQQQSAPAPASASASPPTASGPAAAHSIAAFPPGAPVPGKAEEFQANTAAGQVKGGDPMALNPRSERATTAKTVHHSRYRRRKPPDTVQGR